MVPCPPSFDKLRMSGLAKAGSSSNHAGFTLIEVLLALAIIGLVLTPIFLGQAFIVRSNGRASRYLASLFAAKKYLAETELGLSAEVSETASEKKIDNPRTVLRYELKKIPPTSSLKNFKNVLIERVSWADMRTPKKQDSILTFLYKPEQPS